MRGLVGRMGCLAISVTALALGCTVAVASVEPTERVLVKMADRADRADRQAVGRALNAERVRDVVGGWRIYDLRRPLGGSTVDERVADLAVEQARPDVPVRTMAFTPDDPRYPLQRTYMEQIRAPEAWATRRGAAFGPPVTVAVIDSGIEASHPDLVGRLWVNPGEAGGRDGVDDDGNGVVDDIHGARILDRVVDGRPWPDGSGHGTHVAGLIAAGFDNGIGVAGLAPNARIMAVRFMRGPGDGGYLSDLLMSIDYAVDSGADIINGSWGIDVPFASPPTGLCDALAEAGRRGVLSVVAAGNDGLDVDAPGGNYRPDRDRRERSEPASCETDSMLVVAATDPVTDRLASYSNWGLRSVDLAAPGGSIGSGLWSLCAPVVVGCVGSGADLYIAQLGTSMATPVVAGAAALVLGAAPGLSPPVLSRVLIESGDPVLDTEPSVVPGGPVRRGVIASGRRLNVAAAIARAQNLPQADLDHTSVASVEPADGIALSMQPQFQWRIDGPLEGVMSQRVLVDGIPRAHLPANARGATLDGPLAEGIYRWSVEVVGMRGLAASATRTLTIDTTPPEPVAIAAAVQGDAVALAWGEPRDRLSGMASIRVVRAGSVVAELAGTDRGVVVAGAPAVGRGEVIGVEFIDRAGNRRAQSVMVAGAATPTSPAVPTTPTTPTAPITPTAPGAAGRPPAPPGGGGESVIRTVSVSAATYRRRYEVRLVADGRSVVVARGTLAPRVRSLRVRLTAAQAAVNGRVALRTARMHSTARIRTIRLPVSSRPRSFVVRAHDLSLRWVVARGTLAAGVRTLRLRLPAKVAARGPRVSVHLAARAR